MKYEYGVEYATGFSCPDLPGDVMVEARYRGGGWHRGGADRLDEFNWVIFSHFRIVDERYKQKEEDSTWFERGELPPVGIECEVEYNSAEIKKQFHRVIPVFYGKSLAIFEDVRGGEFAYFIKCCKFRPTKTEREKAIEAAINIICKGNILERDGTEAWRIAMELSDAGLLRLPEEK